MISRIVTMATPAPALSLEWSEWSEIAVKNAGECDVKMKEVCAHPKEATIKPGEKLGFATFQPPTDPYSDTRIDSEIMERSSGTKWETHFVDGRAVMWCSEFEIFNEAGVLEKWKVTVDYAKGSVTPEKL